MALDVNEKQRLRWNAIRKRILFGEKNKTRKHLPSVEFFVEKEKKRK